MSPHRTHHHRHFKPSCAALALGTLPPSEKLLYRRPYSSSTSLVQPRMMRHVAVQAVFQFALLLAILLTGSSWLNVSNEFLDKSGDSWRASHFRRVCALHRQSLFVWFLAGYFVSAQYKPADGEDIARYISTFIFNVFVFCQASGTLAHLRLQIGRGLSLLFPVPRRSSIKSTRARLPTIGMSTDSAALQLFSS